jgi:hypothetical protein
MIEAEAEALRAALAAVNELALQGAATGRCPSCERMTFVEPATISTAHAEVREVIHAPGCRMVELGVELELAVSAFGGHLERRLAIIGQDRAAVVLAWAPDPA